VEIEINTLSSLRVFRLSGDVDLQVAPQVRKSLLDGLKQNTPLLIDLSAVTYMDSSGVACLVEAYQVAKQQQGDFGLVAVAAPVMSVLRLARLDRVFPIYASVEERLARVG